MSMKVLAAFSRRNNNQSQRIILVNIRNNCSLTLIVPELLIILEGVNIMNESKPIIRLFFAKIKEEFTKLSEEEKMAFMSKDRENLDKLGMKAVSMIDCSWSNDEWDYIGVEQWPNKEAIIKREKFEKEELEISIYVESKTYLGTPESFTEYGK